MATTEKYIEYICEQIRNTGDIRYRKMFGEYMVYVDNKPLILVCDNTVFVKKLPCLDEIMENANTGIPYEGAKEHYILDIDNPSLCKEVINILDDVTPLPKKKIKEKEHK